MFCVTGEGYGSLHLAAGPKVASVGRVVVAPQVAAVTAAEPLVCHGGDGDVELL